MSFLSEQRIHGMYWSITTVAFLLLVGGCGRTPFKAPAGTEAPESVVASSGSSRLQAQTDSRDGDSPKFVLDLSDDGSRLYFVDGDSRILVRKLVRQMNVGGEEQKAVIHNERKAASKWLAAKARLHKLPPTDYTEQHDALLEVADHLEQLHRDDSQHLGILRDLLIVYARLLEFEQDSDLGATLCVLISDKLQTFQRLAVPLEQADQELVTRICAQLHFVMHQYPLAKVTGDETVLATLRLIGQQFYEKRSSFRIGVLTADVYDTTGGPADPELLWDAIHIIVRPNVPAGAAQISIYTLSRRGAELDQRWYLMGHALNRTSLIEFFGSNRPELGTVQGLVMNHVLAMQPRVADASLLAREAADERRSPHHQPGGTGHTPAPSANSNGHRSGNGKTLASEGTPKREKLNSDSSPQDSESIGFAPPLSGSSIDDLIDQALYGAGSPLSDGTQQSVQSQNPHYSAESHIGKAHEALDGFEFGDSQDEATPKIKPDVVARAAPRVYVLPVIAEHLIEADRVARKRIVVERIGRGRVSTETQPATSSNQEPPGDEATAIRSQDSSQTADDDRSGATAYQPPLMGRIHWDRSTQTFDALKSANDVGDAVIFGRVFEGAVNTQNSVDGRTGTPFFGIASNPSDPSAKPDDERVGSSPRTNGSLPKKTVGQTTTLVRGADMSPGSPSAGSRSTSPLGIDSLFDRSVRSGDRNSRLVRLGNESVPPPKIAHPDRTEARAAVARWTAQLLDDSPAKRRAAVIELGKLALGDAPITATEALVRAATTDRNESIAQAARSEITHLDTNPVAAQTALTALETIANDEGRQDKARDRARQTRGVVESKLSKTVSGRDILSMRVGGVRMDFDPEMLRNAELNDASLREIENRLLEANGTEEAEAVVHQVVMKIIRDAGYCLDHRELSEVTAVSLRRLCDETEPYRNRWGELPAALRYPGSLRRIYGYAIAPDREDLFILGSSAGECVPLDVDDLAIGIRSVWLEEKIPLCSLDPDPADSAGPQWSRIEGIPFQSSFAKIMLEADYDMKKVSMGLLPVSISGFVPDPVAYSRQPQLLKAPGARFWFHAGSLSPGAIRVAPKSNIVLFDGSMKVETELMNQVWKESLAGRHPIDEAFVRISNSKMDEFEKEIPSYARLHALFDVVLLAKTLRRRKVEAEALDRLVNLPWRETSVPDSYSGLSVAVKAEGRMVGRISGGVTMSTALPSNSFVTVSGQGMGEFAQQLDSQKIFRTISGRELPIPSGTSSASPGAKNPAVSHFRRAIILLRKQLYWLAEREFELAKHLGAHPALCDEQLILLRYERGDFPTLDDLNADQREMLLTAVISRILSHQDPIQTLKDIELATSLLPANADESISRELKLNRVSALLQLGRDSEALDQISAILHQSPDEYRALRIKSLVNLSLERYQQAYDSADAAIRSAGSSSRAYDYILRADALLKIDHTASERLEADFRRAVELEPEEPDAHLFWARYLAFEGDKDVYWLSVNLIFFA